MKRIAAVLLLAACTKRETPPPTAETAAPPAPVLVDAAPEPKLGNPSPDSDACGSMTAFMKNAKSIGHTSVVFKVEMSDGRVHAWKPNAKIVKDRWRGEVAAYRLGEALGIHNVPPACPRAFEASTVKPLIDPKIFDGLIVDENSRIEGAFIPWIEGLQFLAFEKDPLRSESKAWLDVKQPLDPARADLADQYSKLAIFDVITANWDRYSGGNVGADKTGATILFIDNDAAFMDRPPVARLKDNEAIVADGSRFSKSFVAEVKKLDATRLKEIFGLRSGLRPLLDDTRLEEAAKRAHDVSALIEKKGDGALSMP